MTRPPLPPLRVRVFLLVGVQPGHEMKVSITEEWTACETFCHLRTWVCNKSAQAKRFFSPQEDSEGKRCGQIWTMSEAAAEPAEMSVWCESSSSKSQESGCFVLSVENRTQKRMGKEHEFLKKKMCVFSTHQLFDCSLRWLTVTCTSRPSLHLTGTTPQQLGNRQLFLQRTELRTLSFWHQLFCTSNLQQGFVWSLVRCTLYVYFLFLQGSGKNLIISSNGDMCIGCCACRPTKWKTAHLQITVPEPFHEFYLFQRCCYFELRKPENIF